MKISFFCMLMMVVATALAVTVSPSTVEGPSPSPSPSPGPAPAHVNLRQLLSVAGPFSKFLSYLESTKVIDTFQNQADDEPEQGVTIFVPTDGAMKSAATAMRNLTTEQLKSVLLSHGLPQYYSLSDFGRLSQLTSPVSTFAGGDYTLNFTDVSGTVHVNSGWSNTKVASSVFSTSPVAIYEVSKVLLPEAIFGTDIPPAPAPAPQMVYAADSPDMSPSSSSSSSSQHSTSSAQSARSSIFQSSFVLAVISSFAGLVLFFM